MPEVGRHVRDIGIANGLCDADHNHCVWRSGPRAGAEEFQLRTEIVGKLKRLFASQGVVGV